jgi:hypothetical protein
MNRDVGLAVSALGALGKGGAMPEDDDYKPGSLYDFDENILKIFNRIGRKNKLF